MDAEILLISITFIICAFFIALIRVVLRCADEADNQVATTEREGKVEYIQVVEEI